MGFLWIAARKDLRRLLREPLALLLWIGIPLAIGGLLTLAVGGRDGPAPQAHLLVADRDGSFLSKLLLGALSQDAGGAPIRAEAVDEAAGRARLDAGGASALLVIPEGFAEDLLLERPTRLELVINPAQSVLPRIVEETLSILVDGTFYVHRLVGDEVRRFADPPPDGAATYPDAEVAASSVRINRLIERLQATLFPPVLSLAVETSGDDGEDEPAGGLAVLFVPGILLMSLFFMAQGMSEDLWRERDLGTLRRALVAPRPLAAFLGGKLVSGALVMALVAAIGLAVAGLALDLPWSVWAPAVAWSTLTGAALLAGMMVLQLLASSQRAGGILSAAVLFPLLMIGGSFFPFEAMPAWMASIGRRTPNGWAVEELKAILRGGASAGDLARGALGLSAIGAALFALAVRRAASRARSAS